MLLRLDGELEQQQVEGSAQRAEAARGDVRGEREVSGLGEPGTVGDRPTIEEGQELVDAVGGDQGQAVDEEQPPRLGQAYAHHRRRRVAQRRAQEGDGERLADATGQENIDRLGIEPGGTRHGHEGEHVLQRNEAQVEAAVETRPRQSCVIIEQADADGDQPGSGRDHGAALRVLVRGEIEASVQECRCAEAERHHKIGPVETLADPRLVDADAARIEPRRGQAQPLEQEGVQHHGACGGQGEDAELCRPEQLGDEQPDHEIEAGIQDEGDDDGHGFEPCESVRPAGTAPPSYRGEAKIPLMRILADALQNQPRRQKNRTGTSALRTIRARP